MQLDPLTLARLSPAGLAMLASRGRWQLARWLWLLNEKLVAVARGEITRLFVGVPPRHGKSELISKYMPAWYMGTFPDRNIILGTYEATFAASWGRKARDVLEEWGPRVFGVEVAGDSRAAAHWSIKGYGGAMNTAGVGGPMTGKGAHLLIIDDPIKNAQEANSAVKRESTWDWYRSTAFSRLEPDGAVIILQTRWHEDDLAGRVLRQAREEGEYWEVLELPAIAEPDREDPLGRQPGDPLWPGRFNAAQLERIRRTVGEYWWNALYQQRPAPLDGSIFKRAHIRRYRIDGAEAVLEDGDGRQRRFLLAGLRKFATVDLAASTKTTADFTVVATWALTPDGDLLLLDVVRGRFEGPDQPALVRGAFERWRQSWLAIEAVGYQLTLVQQLAREGLPVRPLKADRDKVSRALTAAARMEMGKVFFPTSAPWLGDFEAELLAFPNAAHDDQVDTLAYAALEAVSQVDIDDDDDHDPTDGHLLYDSDL